MRILLDECVDRRLAALILGQTVDSVQDVGCRSIKNGELLRRAEKKYDVFVTVDRNLAFQQPVAKFSLAIVVLRASSNDVDALGPLIPDLLTALQGVRPGTLTAIDGPRSG